MKICIANISKFKSPWYYWYAGYKYRAAFIIFACILVSWLSLGLLAGFNIFYILLLLLIGEIGFVLLLLYLIFLNPYIPDMLEPYLDEIAAWNFVLAVMSVVINRCVTYVLAIKVFGLPTHNGFSAEKEPN